MASTAPTRTPAGSGSAGSASRLAHHPGGFVRAEPERLTGRRLAAAQLTDLQRAKIASAATELFAQRGFREATVAEIIARARVSRTCFYQLFSDAGSCLASILTAASEAVEQQLTSPALSALPAQERIRASLLRLLGFLDADPGLARVCVVEALRADREVLLLRSTLVRRLAVALEHCLSAAAPNDAAPSLRGEIAVESVLAILHSRLFDPEPLPLLPLADDLAEILLMPFRHAERHSFVSRLAGPPSRRRESLRARRPTAASSTGGRPSAARRIARPPGT